MRDASGQQRRQGFTCPVCQRFIVTAVDGLFARPRQGSPQRFCSPACRQAARRRRAAGVDEATPLQRAGGRSLAPSRVRTGYHCVLTPGDAKRLRSRTTRNEHG